jgi:hypothetical protein
MRGSFGSWVSGSRFRPSTKSSSRTPRMRGRSTSNAAQSSDSGRRRSSGIISS